MISYDNNATTTTTIAMRIEKERRAEQQKVEWGMRSAGSRREKGKRFGLGLRENVCWGIAAGVTLAHTLTHARRGGTWARSQSQSGDLSSSSLSAHSTP